MEKNRKPFVIPVFIPHSGCPHRCSFCNQTTITTVDRSLPSPEQFRSVVRKYLSWKKETRSSVQIAFFGGNFLGLAPDYIDQILSEADAFVHEGVVDGIRFSTRPDTIAEKSLDDISSHFVSTIEIGVQSLDDRVLKLAKRGHSAEDSLNAAALLKKRGYETGLQMMTGLYGDTETGALETGDKIAACNPDFVRIYPAVVLKGSHLASLYGKGEYRPMSLDDSVTLVKKLYLMFSEKGIDVIRMGLQASEELDDGAHILAGPYHPAFGHLVFSEVFLDKARHLLSERLPENRVAFFVSPRSISRFRGLKNKNIHALKDEFNLQRIDVRGDSTMDMADLRLG